MYKRDKSLREDITFPQRRRTPSFSSTLLDSIYRSIDESNGHQEELNFYRETTTTKAKTTMSMIKKQNNSTCLEQERDVSNLRRAIMIESWMEKQSNSNSNGSTKFFSTSSSSDSSSGGVLSSSEESCYKEKSRTASGFTRQRSKQVRSDKCLHFEQRNVDNKQPNPKREGGFTKTKLKALKIYGELKKVKQPISPGGRIASFLNSIFNSSNAKKVAMCSVGAMEDVSYERKSKSTCSSTTSFSRSCLSKTPASRGKYSSNGMKRSVRFCPVSVIVDEDCRPCGHKRIYEDDPRLMPTPTVQKVVKSSSLKEVIHKNYGVKNTTRHDFLNCYQENDNGDDDDDIDDDALSYSSSDLFELDHLIGIGRYREELPVFETTNMKTNQAIASGFIL